MLNVNTSNFLYLLCLLVLFSCTQENNTTTASPPNENMYYLHFKDKSFKIVKLEGYENGKLVSERIVKGSCEEDDIYDYKAIGTFDVFDNIKRCPKESYFGYNFTWIWSITSNGKVMKLTDPIKKESTSISIHNSDDNSHVLLIKPGENNSFILLYFEKI